MRGWLTGEFYLYFISKFKFSFFVLFLFPIHNWVSARQAKPGVVLGADSSMIHGSVGVKRPEFLSGDILCCKSNHSHVS